jgi:hypothetical protein
MLESGDAGLKKTSKQSRSKATGTTRDWRSDSRVAPGRDTPGFAAFRAYFNALTPEQRHQFARDCETTELYIRKALFRGKVGPAMALRWEKASGGEITRDMLYPKWRQVWDEWEPPKRSR